MTKDECIMEEAKFIVATKSTIRKTAKVFGISKSLLYVHVTKRLPEISSKLYSEVRKVLDVNKAERHLRGGYATRDKYLRARES